MFPGGVGGTGAPSSASSVRLRATSAHSRLSPFQGHPCLSSFSSAGVLCDIVPQYFFCSPCTYTFYPGAQPGESAHHAAA
eukprot:gene10530-biopygen3305